MCIQTKTTHPDKLNAAEISIMFTSFVVSQFKKLSQKSDQKLAKLNVEMLKDISKEMLGKTKTRNLILYSTSSFILCYSLSTS